MELNIKDRLLIPGILPQNNNFMDFNLKKSILQKITISEKDRNDYRIVEHREEGRIEWDLNKDRECPLQADFTAEEIKYLQKACEQISDQTMPDDTWATVEKIYNMASC